MTSQDQVEKNKSTAKEFLQKVFGDHDFEALYNYLAPELQFF